MRRLISLEDFLCVVIESWVGEQFRWQKRIEKLFDHASSAGCVRALQELLCVPPGT
jgi:hypothetical protein